MNVDDDRALSGALIGAAISVHRQLGPGADEAAYEEALSVRLTGLGISHECQMPVPLAYKGFQLECGFRLDVLVDGRLPVELKAVDAILPVHEAQLLTYLRLLQRPLGLLVNFEVAILREGIRRRVLTRPRKPSHSTEVYRCERFDPLSAELLRAATEVRRELGSGLLRSAYEECLCHELDRLRIPFVRRRLLPLHFDGMELTRSVEVPLLVANQLPVFCLSATTLTKLHESRLLARLRQGKWPCGFLLNFSAPTLAQGIRRLTVK